MSENSDRMNSSRKPARLQTLAEQLAALDSGEGSFLPTDMEMLSLIISGALRGENIAQRFPAFYQKLLENASLRQAFLEGLASVEAERAGELIPLPKAAEVGLGFLKHPSPDPVLAQVEKDRWQITWQRTLDELQAIFSPSEMAFRAEGELVEDPWFTLLRDEISTQGVTYNVLLDCTLSSEEEDSLAPFLSVAVTLGNNVGPARFPLRARLNWGDYEGSVLMTEDGRFRLPDIPLGAAFEEADSRPRAGFRLSLETAS